MIGTRDMHWYGKEAWRFGYCVVIALVLRGWGNGVRTGDFAIRG